MRNIPLAVSCLRYRACISFIMGWKERGNEQLSLYMRSAGGVVVEWWWGGGTRRRTQCCLVGGAGTNAHVIVVVLGVLLLPLSGAID